MNQNACIKYFALVFLTLICLQFTGCNPSTILSTTTPYPPPMITTTPDSIETATEAADLLTIRMWLPPQFDPASGTLAGTSLNAQLEKYLARHVNVTLDVRIKSTSGTASLLESLTLASSIAQSALPDLVALERRDLEDAVQKGLINPMDGETLVTPEQDWYGYARQVATIQNSIYGIPFAGDALVLVYHPSTSGELSPDWDMMHTRGLKLAFPAADAQALFTLILYQSFGGAITDDQGRPTLDAQILTSVLEFYQSGIVFPNSVKYQTDEQAWEAFGTGYADMVITWVSRYLQEMPSDAAMLPIPNLGETAFTYADGWLWVIAARPADRHAAAIDFAEHLVDVQYMAEWTSAAGLLPTHPSTLAAWENDELEWIGEVVLAAQSLPTEEILAILGPVVRDAVIQTLQGQYPPSEAARLATERLE